MWVLRGVLYEAIANACIVTLLGKHGIELSSYMVVS